MAKKSNFMVWLPEPTTRGVVALTLLAALGTPACVASQDVKTASKAVTKTLTATRGAEKDFTQALLAEVDSTQSQVERALTARIVYTEIQKIAADLETRGDLISLSKKISDAELRGARFLEVVSEAKPPDNVATADMTAWVRSIAKLPPDAPDPLASLGIKPDELRTLLQLRGLRQKAQTVTSQLDTHLAAITALHAQVDAWIQTDVTVKGEDVAKAIEAVAARFPATPEVTP
jgi:hypothetical protein